MMEYETPTLRKLGQFSLSGALGFAISSPLPTFNEMEASRGSTFGKDKRQNAYNVAKQAAQRDVGLVAMAAARTRRMALPLAGPLTVTCFWGDCRFDPDNQAAGIKIVLDALVQAGILENDRRYRPGGGGTIRAILHDFPDDTVTRPYAAIFQLTPWERTP